MEVEAAVIGHGLPEEAQGGDHAVARVRIRHIPALLADAERGQAEPRSGNTGHDAGIRLAHVAAVLHEPGIGIGLIEEELTVGPFEILKERVVLRRELRQ